MLKGLFRKLKGSGEGQCEPYPPLTHCLEENINRISEIFKGDETLIIRRFHNMYSPNLVCCVIFIDGMVDVDVLNENIIKPIQSRPVSDTVRGKKLLRELMESIIESNNAEEKQDMDYILESILYGDTLLLTDNCNRGVIISSKGWKTRSISEPASEKVVRGPREGFTECLMTNLTLIRRRIQDPGLKFRFLKLGLRSRTRICICYIEGIASEDILKELYSRLEKIKIDAILDSGYIQELIKDAPYSPFDTIGTTERPDVACAKMLEGRITIVVDGSPFALTLPYLFVEYFQVNEDYYNNYVFASFNRLIRIVGATLTITVPALYVAVVTFHQELLPTFLLLSISASRQGVPFPTVVEAMLMIFIFEILREAGTRIPTPIGQTISIVGALVLGQAAVDARIVSAPIIIVTALTGITSLLSFRLLGAPILIRLVFLLLSSVLGFFGLVYGLIGLVIHLMSLRSFGVPFTLNVTSLKGQEIKDTAIRVPWWYMRTRPPLMAQKNRKRMSGEMGLSKHAKK
jgi:spore germination protein KA